MSGREWRVVQARAAAASDPGREAARMADYIAFQKQYLAWRRLASGDDPARRDQLAQGLLDQLPSHVAEGTLALQQAQSIQDELIEARVADPAQRLAAVAAERLRLPPQPQAASFAQ